MSVLHLVFDSDSLPQCAGLLADGDFVVLMGESATALKQAGSQRLTAAVTQIVASGALGAHQPSISRSGASTDGLPPEVTMVDDVDLVTLVIHHDLSQTW